LHEVLAVSDRVAVLRKGQYIGDVLTKDANQQSLTDMMVGRAVSLNIDRPQADELTERLRVEHLTVKNKEGVKKLIDVSFTAHGGEILGIAGIAGSGQKELLEAIAGLRHVTSGSIIYTPSDRVPMDLVGKTPMEIRDSGVALAFVPEDRLGMGLVGGMGMTDNMLLRSWNSGKGIFVDRKAPAKMAESVHDFLEVVTPSIDYPVRKLSGGNVQKVLVGREIAASPSVLMSAYAVRGLDINTSYIIYDLMAAQKSKGVAVVFVGEDLDVLLALSDRILVLCGGRVSGIVDARTATKEQIGLLMINEGGKENS
jgi:simple sugar transport system ATP-binding protein